MKTIPAFERIGMEEQRKWVRYLWDTRADVQKDLKMRREKHKEDVMTAYFSRLSDADLVPEPPTAPNGGEANDITILRKLDEMQSNLGSKLDTVQRSQSLIYGRIGTEARATVDSILSEVRAQSLSQSEMKRTLDAIRRVLKHVQQTGLPVDSDTKKLLDEIYSAISSDIGFSQQLELSLPIIPFLLNYNITLGTDVDLKTVWKELTVRVQEK